MTFVPKLLLVSHEPISPETLEALEAAGLSPGEARGISEPPTEPTLAVLYASTEERAKAWIAPLTQSSYPCSTLLIVPALTDNYRALARSVDDFIVGQASDLEVTLRVQSMLSEAERLNEVTSAKRDAEVMLELTQALSSSLDFREILYTVVRRIAEVMLVDRVSVVVTPESDAGDVGYVVVASDDSALANLRIDLKKYPEIQSVLRSGESLTIHDAATHPILDSVRDSFVTDKLSSMTLFPITWRGQAVGVLFLRSAVERGVLDERETRFCQVIANATAVALRNARVMQSLRDHTQEITFARFEAEQRLEELHRYADLFTSAAEGIAVIDEKSGRLLFANPRAYEIVAASPATHENFLVRKLIHRNDRSRIIRLWADLPKGIHPRGVDLRVQRAGEDYRICTASFSTLADAPDSVLVTFQDVTEQRRTEAELVKTMEFLESLVDASVDGIVAADMNGNVILFNRGAEAIYGYAAEEVIGRLTTRDLYPPGEAYQIMRRLRSDEHGGAGRLSPSNLHARAKGGENIPIRLSASMIYEAGEPSATFGIFTDLREKLLVEGRLAEAQGRLAASEKNSLVAERAGTAAHELNQPLTSLMAYAELLKRKIPTGTPEHRAASVMYREADRMADIVRKIGRMSRYETKSYVGEQRILDIEKASDER
ncbi:MAG: PAS domain S-box protein [Polyangiales bacterium]